CDHADGNLHSLGRPAGYCINSPAFNNCRLNTPDQVGWRGVKGKSCKVKVDKCASFQPLIPPSALVPWVGL
ncbi:hypothetical protein CRENBAI_013112, partial [Crenichthys baileyi]